MPRRVAIVLLVLAAGTAVCAAPPSWQGVRTKTAPAIDGALDDPCWREQTKVNNFRDPLTGEPAPTQTYFSVLYDDDALYFAITCPEPQMARLRADLQAHDDTLWSDDCVELFIDPANQRDSYAHLIVNPNGALYDAWVSHGGSDTDMDWESGAQAAAGKRDDAWQVELRVPFAGLRLPRDVKPDWAFNLCREKKTPPAELSCWSPPMAEGFQHPAAFGMLTGLKVNFRAQLVSIDTPQFRNPTFERRELTGSLVIPYVNWTGRDIAAQVTAVFTDLEGHKSQTDGNAVIRGGRGQMAIPVTIDKPGVAELQLDVSRRTPPKLLHRSRHAMDLSYQPVQITLLAPAYRDTIFATLPTQEIICRLRPNLTPAQTAGAELRVTFNAGATELAVRTVRRVSPTRDVEVAFSSEIVPAGDYLIKAQVLKQGKVIGEGEKAVRKVRPQPHEVVVDHEGQLRVDGRKFFPCGFMGAEPDPQLARAGFNTIHTYTAWYIHRDQDLTEWLDQAQKLGLKVVLPPYPGEVGFYGFRKKPAIGDTDIEDIVKFVDRYKAHPAVLAWYMCDEPRGALWRANLAKVYHAVAEADPYHPCVALDNGVSTLTKLRTAGDILWIDPYPGFTRGGPPRQPLTLVGQALQGLRAALPDRRPLWIAPQAFSYAEWDKSKAVREREPTLTEIRAMHYLSLLNGAGGIIPFAWAYAKRHPSTLQTYLELIGPEMSILMPALLEGKGVEHCRLVPLSPGADAQMGVWEHEGNLFLVLANRKPEEARIRVIIPGLDSRWLKVVAENRRVQAFGDTLDETLPPYGVRIYSDKKKLPAVLPLAQVEQRIKNDEAAKTATW